MSTQVTLMSNMSSHAWLSQWEKTHKRYIGPRAYPLPPPSKAFHVQIRQAIGFGTDPCARFESKTNQADCLTWLDFGLFAPLGPLPMQLTEEMLLLSRSELLSKFVNAITQRMFHFYYQSWSALRPEHEFDVSTNSFSALTKLLSGYDSQPPWVHLAWLKPTVAQLPIIVERYLGLTLKVIRQGVRRVRNDMAYRLGASRLGEQLLGQQLSVWGHGKVQLFAYPQTLQSFASLRKLRSDDRIQLMRLVHLCVHPHSDVSLQVVAPQHVGRCSLGTSRLGVSQLHMRNTVT
jgi:predicted component of type VI protein secretion system